MFVVTCILVKQQLCAEEFPSLWHSLQDRAFLLTVVSACIRSCNTNNFTQSLTKIYYYTATENPYFLRGAKTHWTPTLAEVSYKFGFLHFAIRLQCKISRSLVFSFFFHKVLNHKMKKVTDPSF